MHDNSALHTPSPSIRATTDDDGDHLRLLSRSPHPYHRQKSELLEPSDILVYRAAASPAARNSADAASLFARESTPASDSGTEADDEHVLKRLPAPKARSHKGLRGQNEPLSGTSTPMLSPAITEEQYTPARSAATRNRREGKRLSGVETIRRRKELVRRSAEVLLLGCLGALVLADQNVQAYTALYHRGMCPVPWLSNTLLTPGKSSREAPCCSFPSSRSIL